MRVARLVKDNLGGFNGHAALYKVSPSVQYRKYDWVKDRYYRRQSRYIVVSAVVVDGMPEAYLFPADKSGQVKSWSRLPGSMRGSLNHADALEGGGYLIES
jgi:hypothetical protein